MKPLANIQHVANKIHVTETALKNIAARFYDITSRITFQLGISSNYGSDQIIIIQGTCKG